MPRRAHLIFGHHSPATGVRKNKNIIMSSSSLEWLESQVLPSERALDAACSGVEGFYDPKKATEPELRRYRGFRGHDQGQAGNCASEIGVKVRVCARTRPLLAWRS
jgi:hypothetical protein